MVKPIARAIERRLHESDGLTISRWRAMFSPITLAFVHDRSRPRSKAHQRTKLLGCSETIHHAERATIDTGTDDSRNHCRRLRKNQKDAAEDEGDGLVMKQGALHV